MNKKIPLENKGTWPRAAQARISINFELEFNPKI